MLKFKNITLKCIFISSVINYHNALFCVRKSFWISKFDKYFLACTHSVETHFWGLKFRQLNDIFKKITLSSQQLIQCIILCQSICSSTTLAKKSIWFEKLLNYVLACTNSVETLFLGFEVPSVEANKKNKKVVPDF